MSNLQDFLDANLVDNLTEEVSVSPRFKDKDGKPLKFTIKAMTNLEFDEIRKSCTNVRKGRKIDIDANALSLKMVINHTISPDFRAAESLKKTGSLTPEEYVQKVLLAGEVTTLAQKIQALSGFDTAMDELVEEAKN
jgi:hypothetical protein